MLRTTRGAWLATLCVTACGAPSAQPAYQVHTLASGQQVKVLGVGTVNFPQSGPALMLKYQTDLSMADTTALRAEADRIWEEFRADAERAQVQRAIISANSAPTGGVVSRGRMYNFGYEKATDGTWHAAHKP